MPEGRGEKQASFRGGWAGVGWGTVQQKPWKAQQGGKGEEKIYPPFLLTPALNGILYFVTVPECDV